MELAVPTGRPPRPGIRCALLDIAPDDPQLVARPMIQIEIDGEKKFLVFDIVKYFDTLEEAKEYTKEKNLPYILQN